MFSIDWVFLLLGLFSESSLNHLPTNLSFFYQQWGAPTRLLCVALLYKSIHYKKWYFSMRNDPFKYTLLCNVNSQHTHMVTITPSVDVDVKSFD